MQLGYWYHKSLTYVTFLSFQNVNNSFAKTKNNCQNWDRIPNEMNQTKYDLGHKSAAVQAYCDVHFVNWIIIYQT